MLSTQSIHVKVKTLLRSMQDVMSMSIFGAWKKAEDRADGSEELVEAIPGKGTGVGAKLRLDRFAPLHGNRIVDATTVGHLHKEIRRVNFAD